jgi:hypothetical protein
MFDTQCFQLAQDFLDDEPINRRTIDQAQRLAQVIQDAIEAYLEDLRRSEEATDATV